MTTKKFFAPHSGKHMEGAAAAPPAKLAAAAAVLEGLDLEVDTVVKFLSALASSLKLGPVELSGNAIMVYSGQKGRAETIHCWAIIRFEPA